MARKGGLLVVDIDEKALARAQKRVAQYEGRPFRQRMERIFKLGGGLLVRPMRARIKATTSSRTRHLKGGTTRPPGMLAKKVTVRKGRAPVGYIIKVGTKSRAPHAHLVSQGHRITAVKGGPTFGNARSIPFVEQTISSNERKVIDFIAKNVAADNVGVTQTASLFERPTVNFGGGIGSDFGGTIRSF